MIKNKAAIKVIEDLIKADPQRVAGVFENLEVKEAVNLFKNLSVENQVKCLKHLNSRSAGKILQKLPPETAKEILSRTEKYKIVSIIKTMSENRVKAILQNMDESAKTSLYYLFDYPKNSAGRLMYPDFISLKKTLDVSEAVAKLRLLARFNELKSYIYVVDDQNNLSGVLNMRDLVISDERVKLEDIMIKKVMKVSPYAHKDDLVKIFSSKNFISLPVVDASGKILGIIESKDVMESAREESIEDMQLLLGSNPDEKIDSPLGFKIKNRLKWLIINLFTVFMSAGVVAFFESTIAMITALAVILPMIPGQGAAAGAQTLSVVIRSIVMGEIDLKNVRKIIYTEITIGLVNGLVSGLITGVVFWLWKDTFLLGFVVFAAMTLNMIIAGIAGALIPILMRRMNLDPAHSSIVILTTVTDVAGLFILLMLGKLLLL
ncbi:MAG: magnesium transporter [Elusimicrobia bacterium CG08_land_8_20_14_0_20_51_18]|nr:MAG: magnesium transporter [Elusimicrobia bacterium CG08_land_8_20_14_0_20_51_18]